MMKQNTRRERGVLQRDQLRRLVAGGGSSTYGLEGPEDVARLGAGASWWSRQSQWGETVTAPATQLAATIQTMASSSPHPALLFELGRMALGFSQSLGRVLDDAIDEIAPPASGAAAVAGHSCPICRDAVGGSLWTDHEFEFLRIACTRCQTMTTIARTATDSPVRWASPRFEEIERTMVLGFPRAAVSAVWLDGGLIGGRAVKDDRLAIEPEYPAARSDACEPAIAAQSRIMALLDLAPIKIAWSR
ncbi:MAG: hypothetical protein AUG49_19565 [Catenulispora sp. 13_1_20CM_3_70_7]|nr:MAG: hypothetical protein AUG49_19565 [Catenulispora sp. 13_1_20CM_3_70_7]